MLAVDLLTRVGLATVLGIAIGFERQWRSRMAGLQTMALVSMGSALFLILSAYSFDQTGDRLRVAAQIVSGVGFLGAGVIMKQGLSVTGLNTAATLWATAAVGALAGARMDRAHSKRRDATPAEYVLEVVCQRAVEEELRVLISEALPSKELQLRGIQVNRAQGPDTVQLQAEFATAARDDDSAVDAVRALSPRPGVTSVRWSIAHEGAADWSR
jgi:putative Mg2+ transporter-C (MgtC) family protein